MGGESYCLPADIGKQPTTVPYHELRMTTSHSPRRTRASRVSPDWQRIAFSTGAATLDRLPSDLGREVAFAGRSNAGKSSAINTLVGRGRLARVSKTPGRTQQINFFAIDEQRRLVDLPGYGYAKVPARVRARWGTLVEGYLRRRRSLAGMVLLMDARRAFTPLDEQLLHWCLAARVPTHVLLTKADKLNHGAAARALQAARARLASEGGECSVQLFSAVTGRGRSDLERQLQRWLGPGPDGPGASSPAPAEKGEKSPGSMFGGEG